MTRYGNWSFDHEFMFMIKKCFFSLALSILSGLILFSCRKELINDNKPPIAHAGRDTIILSPQDSVTLDGSASNDPGGSLREYLWSKVSGSSSFSIIHPQSVQTLVKNLTTGVYRFELQVTDNMGLSAKDTLTVTVDAASTNNHQPTADAGPDQNISLPADTIILDGRRSSDIDNNITGYAWAKISGPISIHIVNANTVQTTVTSLVEGVCHFELKVTDAGGLTARDTVQVVVSSSVVTVSCDTNRPVIHARLVPVGFLSEGRIGLVSAAASNKILFGGGMVTGAYSSRVDIYNTTTKSWSTAELTKPERQGMVVATVANKILFAGGGDNDNGGTTTRVDVYDASNNTWSTAELSKGREYLAAATLGNKVFFAGGTSWETDASGYSTWVTSNVVDIYDNSTNTWTTDNLSESRSDLSATAAGNKIYFAGGYKGPFTTNLSKTIDVYDGTTSSWSTSQLWEAKASHADITIGNKIFWAGGVFNNNGLGLYPSNHVEIRDIITGVTSFACFIPKIMFKAVVKENNIVFFSGNLGNGHLSGNEFDMYNLTTNKWSTLVLNTEIYDATVISVNNTIYVAGGRNQAWGPYFKEVWKLEY